MGHDVEVTVQEKPVVASMVNVAASGGYHIAYRASKIIADPGTITGSIGSINGKFNMTGLHEKLGITHDFVTRGPNALMYSSYTDFTEDQWRRFTEDHWASFNHWLQDVAEHRQLSFEEAEQLAHGRVWTGLQAVQNGLIDEVGDFHRAVELAKELAEIPADEQVNLVHYPKKQGLLETIIGGESAAGPAARWLVYRTIRDDYRQTMEILRHNPDLAAEALTP
jgi:protease-4